jgi:hypothetical protein
VAPRVLGIQLARKADGHDASGLERVVEELGGERCRYLADATHRHDHAVALPARDPRSDRSGSGKAADEGVSFLLERRKNRNWTQIEGSG